MTKEHCLQIAIETITGGRQDAYGKPENSFGKISEYWSAYLNIELTPEDVGHMMILLKLARCTGQKFHADNYIDLAGYAACVCEIASGGDYDSEDYIYPQYEADMKRYEKIAREDEEE